METSLKTDFAQIFSRCPKNLSCPKFGGAAAPLAPPARTPMMVFLSLLACGYRRIYGRLTFVSVGYELACERQTFLLAHRH